MNFLDIIRGVSVIQFIIVGLFLLTNKKGNRLSNLMLAVFLISKAICYFGDYTYSYFNYFLHTAPFIFIICSSFDLLLGPPLYLYSKALMYKDFSLKKYDLLHLIPFIIYLFYYGIEFLYHSPNNLTDYFTSDFLSSTTSIVINSAVHLHFIIYSILCLFSLQNYRTKLKNEYSSLEKKKMLWLTFLVAGFIAVWLGGYLNYRSTFFGGVVIIPWSLIIFLIFAFANIVLYMGLKQPELFSGIIQKDSIPKYAKTALPEEKKDEYLNKLLDYMKEEKPYLNPSITIDEIAESISVPPHYISQVINTSLKQNFYDFVNSYRVEESKYYFQNNAKNTVLEVLYDVGFNSKASFNRAFKKNTGMTPSEFKRNYNIS